MINEGACRPLFLESPLSLITLDFETYYSKSFSLSRLPTEEYIRSPEFEVIGVGIKIDTDPVRWYSGSRESLRKTLLSLDWRNSNLLCHNTMFDGAILKWFFGISPKFYLDTLCMARAMHGVEVGGSLRALAERYQLGVKGDEVLKAIGKHQADFTPIELAEYGEYCMNDVQLTYDLFFKLVPAMPESELDLINMTIRMFTHPKLMIDEPVLYERLKALNKEKQELLSSLKDELECEDEEAVRKKLASNPQFAKVLRDFGVEPEMKISKTTGKPTLALAKGDPQFIALTEHEDSFIQHLCAVRLGTKSTIEESRIQRFIDIGKRNRGTIPIPLKYYGAHTGRWAGYDKVNFQNLPSRDPKKKALKRAIVAPEGYVVINCDSSQIEARVLAWLSGQSDLVKAFSAKEDVYKIMASKIYAKEVEDIDKDERFVGKTTILGCGYGMGGSKFMHQLKSMGRTLTEKECKDIVTVYRDTYPSIKNLWTEGDTVLKKLVTQDFGDAPYYFGVQKCVKVDGSGVILPNGLGIRYKDLRHIDEIIESGSEEEADTVRQRTIYSSRKGDVSIWGGTFVENVVQALARIIVGEQMNEINKKYQVVLTVHDAAVIVAPEDEVDKAIAFVTGIMSTPPAWAPGLPVACEAGFAQNYGDC